ncbi:hypothetical protein IL252_07420 [Halomicrobium sp. IBSBa]|uniref:hypothetical protein n=1 Tax=Halomicrobium sp. IBSBa TaxID=2778916 RepID=UPI001ABF880F|nr:hypothetical protein [Halomicrobium sp. IBSBa]MBO4247644.1 hypothetical protein [Halomicrobium sp. IBSBa]
MKLTRRQLLAGVGLGTVGVGGFGFGRSRPPYTHYTYAADGDPEDRRLRVAWYERYNGAIVETQGDDATATAAIDPDSDPAYVEEATLVTDVTGPVISIGNVMPRDVGALVVGIEVADDLGFSPESVDIWGKTTLISTENGVNGPELADGDTSPSDGELADELLVTLWADDSPVGACNGVVEFDERLAGLIADDVSMREAFGADSDLGGPAGTLVAESVRPGERTCLSLLWAFDEAVATNRSQGDGVVFDLSVAGVPVGSPSPFSDGGA